MRCILASFNNEQAENYNASVREFRAQIPPLSQPGHDQLGPNNNWKLLGIHAIHIFIIILLQEETYLDTKDLPSTHPSHLLGALYLTPSQETTLHTYLRSKQFRENVIFHGS